MKPELSPSRRINYGLRVLRVPQESHTSGPAYWPVR
jgi:hypothetical protein